MYHHESEEIYKLLNYDAILFDVDGTLIDSAPGIINTLKEVFAKMGVDTTNVNLRRYLGPPLRKSFGEHFTDPALIEKATDLYRDSYAVKGSHECAAYPGAAERRHPVPDGPASPAPCGNTRQTAARFHICRWWRPPDRRPERCRT